WFEQTPEKLQGITDMERFSKNKMPYVEVSSTKDVNAAKIAVLSGPAVLIMEGITGALIIDTRTYPSRSIQEPEKDKSLRGPRDGFVETLVMNTAMVRRRIRDERLRMEYFQIGKGTKLDVVISYIDGVADKKTLDIIRKKLKEITINGISMTQQALCESLVKTSFFCPFPKFKFSERPDYTSASILEGKIAVIMDNSPSVMLLPTNLWDFFREADDYYFLPLAGSYTRIIRILVIMITVVGTPIYLLAVNNPQYIPDWLQFIKPTVSGSIPLFVQFVILELIIDGLRLASLNTPNTLSSSFGIIGGLLLSEFAINAGWLITEAILLMAFVTIASFSLPSFEMGYAMKFERLLLLILSELFGLWGFIGGCIFIIIAMFSVKTVTGKDYMYPIYPFNLKDFIRLFIRPSINKGE
ncbi:MAG: spore germination protein, partial [Clostridia bacterium]|nr:spore germination protein [Clostridia bacterium]